MTEHEAKIIVSLADNDLNVSETSRQLYMHRNTLLYHFRKIKKQTGKDPTKFYDMCELLPVAKSVLGISKNTANALEMIGRNAHGEV